MKKTLLGAVFASALLAAGAGAHADSITIRVSPPAPRHEVVPAARPGHVWARGHYEWRNGNYLWIPGHWMTARNGYVYREARWVQRANGSWVMVGNTWERGAYGDRDHDGVANRYDRDRDGDGIRNGADRFPARNANGDHDRDGVANRYDRDADGDGVPNNRDRAPYNRSRS